LQHNVPFTLEADNSLVFKSVEREFSKVVVLKFSNPLAIANAIKVETIFLIIFKAMHFIDLI
jgi:hypothetical protein